MIGDLIGDQIWSPISKSEIKFDLIGDWKTDPQCLISDYNKSVESRSPTNVFSVVLIYPVFLLLWLILDPMTLVWELCLDISLLYLSTRSELSRSNLLKLRTQTRQTDRQTNKCDRTHYCSQICIILYFLNVYLCSIPLVTAPCGLRGCKNRAHSVSWPEVVKAVPNQGVDCFVS